MNNAQSNINPSISPPLCGGSETPAKRGANGGETQPSLVDKIVRAVLYEGYILYPYRPSVKTQQRWTFGGVFPQTYSIASDGSDPHQMQTQCLLRDNGNATITVTLRFLQVVQRTVEVIDPNSPSNQPTFHSVTSMNIDGNSYQTWQEAIERKVELRETVATKFQAMEHFNFPFERTVEMLHDSNGRLAGRLARERQRIEGAIELCSENVGRPLPAASRDGKPCLLYMLTIKVRNLTPLDPASPTNRDLAQLRSFASTHLILTTPAGGFVSATDPPEDLKELAAQCTNTGCWPVLIGEPGQTDTLLASPIILQDYPEIAPESPGDLFDGCEIDEILTLRIMTLTDEEKRQAIAVDPLAADMMARTTALAREQLMNLHGAMRTVTPSISPPLCGDSETPAERGANGLGDGIIPWDPLAEHQVLERALAAGVELKPGDRVRLRPRSGGDIMDIALAGKAATVAAIEQDFENKIHVAVTVDDDPGRDLGMAGKIGHRFFFSLDEIEIIGDEETRA